MVQTVFITLYKQIQALRRQEPPPFVRWSTQRKRLPRFLECQNPGPLNGDGIFRRNPQQDPLNGPLNLSI